MSVKIVFNGKEYDGVDAMPPDVRKAYETLLQNLGKAGDGALVSLLKQGLGTSIKATFWEIVVNGKKYGSLDEMPPEIRRTYEEAMAGLDPDRAETPSGMAPSRQQVQPPPIIEDDDAGRRSPLRIALWIAVGAAVAWWLLRHG